MNRRPFVNIRDWPAPTTPAEEAELGGIIRAGGPGAVEARNRLASAHLPFAFQLAERTARKFGMDVDDAFGAAQFGLIHAAEKFDPSKGFRFTTYARPWIYQTIQREKPRVVGAVSVPCYHLSGGDRPYADDADRGMRRPVSLDAPLRPSGRGSIGALIADARSAGESERAADAGPLRDRLREAVRSLPLREGEAVARSLGLDGTPETQEEIARSRGVSRSAVSNAYLGGVKKLRRLLAPAAEVAAAP